MEDDKLSVFTLFWLFALVVFGSTYVLSHGKEWWRWLTSQAVSQPPSIGRRLSTAAGSPKSAAAIALANGEWKEQVDPSSGKTFYFHAASGKTTWDLERELS
eukprot:TRINITY_DN17143_c0_g1_i1.p2 TRINITY_DN17143_c0_g1~~TRINITY_DN17143_c0_g1_i1.p2  ORF type:complete len:102 (+),score=9.95 TRINITY_DN17143_c0_g1_i1:49-354(+)